ncbi:MAG: hypothetical protein AAF628_07265 [Planctomycetota bacterium]
MDFVALKAMAAGGDEKAQVEVFLTRLGMGTVSFTAAKEQLQQLKGTDTFASMVDDAKSAEIQQHLVNLEFQGALDGLIKASVDERETARTQAADAMYAMKQEGRIPDSQMAYMFWSIMLSSAMQQEDKKKVLEIAGDWKQRLDPESRQDQRLIEQLDQVLEGAQSEGAPSDAPSAGGK